jgi:hypothetical protein
VLVIPAGYPEAGANQAANAAHARRSRHAALDSSSSIRPMLDLQYRGYGVEQIGTDAFDRLVDKVAA